MLAEKKNRIYSEQFFGRTFNRDTQQRSHHQTRALPATALLILLLNRFIRAEANKADFKRAIPLKVNHSSDRAFGNRLAG